MKNFVKPLWLLIRRHKKKLMIMRNALLLILLSAFQVLASNSYSQTKKLSVNLEEATVKQVLTEDSATYTSTVDLASGIDLSTVYNIKISVSTESGTVTHQMGLQGATPSATTRAEIMNKINTTFGFTLAEAEAGGSGEEYIKFTAPIIGEGSFISFQAPTTADCTQEVLGLNEA